MKSKPSLNRRTIHVHIGNGILNQNAMLNAPFDYNPLNMNYLIPHIWGSTNLSKGIIRCILHPRSLPFFNSKSSINPIRHLKNKRVKWILFEVSFKVIDIVMNAYSFHNLLYHLIWYLAY